MLFPFNILYSHEYDSMIVENKLWSEVVCIYNFSGGLDAIFTTYYKFEGDTNINGKTYKILFSNYSDSLMQYWDIESYLREDSMKVYKFIYDEEILIYDFGILPGDTICIVNGCDIVVSVDTILVNEKTRKSIYFYYSNDTWIEGIGSIYRPFNPFTEMVDIGYDLLCCQQNSNIIYQHPWYSTCYIYYSSGYKILKANPKELIKIEPNPFSDYTYISINENISTYNNKLYLLNLSGQIIKEIDVINNSTLLSREDLISGLYFIKLITNKKNTIHTKLIIK
jgi:hypothetical protein